MSCNSCENNCVQTLNVLQSNFNVNDTNTVDLTLSSGILSADVINDPNGGLTSTVNGEAIKLDPDPCNSLTLSSNGLLGPAKHFSNVYQGAWNGTNYVSNGQPTTGFTATGPISTLVVFNQSTCLDQVLDISIQGSYAIETNGVNEQRVTFNYFQDIGAGVFSLSDITISSVGSHLFGITSTSQDSTNRAVPGYNLPAGASVTLRSQQSISVLSSGYQPGQVLSIGGGFGAIKVHAVTTE